MFFCSESVKKRKTPPVCRFLGPQKCENQMCGNCSNNNNSNNNNNNNNNKKKKKKERRRTRTRTRDGLELFGNCEAAPKPNCGTLARTYVVCHRRKATLAAPNLSTHCRVPFYSFLCSDSIHKHPCLTLVLCGCMFATCPPFRATRSTLPFPGGLDYTFGLSLLLWALSFPTVTLFEPVLPTQTPQLDSHECP